ncbi:MAG: MFS transporter [Anaerolineae bacterium]|nr:MFS transporter [Anaerolineae bacterium]
MWSEINRNNRLFMLGNFLFALSDGLWMNLRQLHLGNLGATPLEVGSVLGIVALAGSLLPLPAGILTDRIGPKRVILGSWLIAAVGTIIAALATDWYLASLGFGVFMLVIAANPATVTYVILNTDDQQHGNDGQAQRVMATVFASWPAAMIFAPTVGGLIAERWGIASAMWIATLGFVVSVAAFAFAKDVRPTQIEQRSDSRSLFGNQRFVALTIYYSLVLVALYLGYALAPTYLEMMRGYSTADIGFLFSILSLGSLGFNIIVRRTRSQVSFVVLIVAIWVGTLLIWLTKNALVMTLAFALLGAISTMWLLAQSSFGQIVKPQQRGLALGITETVANGAVALASWLAGALYERTAAHDLPLIVGAITIGVAFVLWFAFGIGRLMQVPDSNSSELDYQQTNEQPAA